MENLYAVGVLAFAYAASFALTVAYYLTNKTLGSLTKGWYHIEWRIVKGWITIIFVGSFVNALLFLLDDNFKTSWAVWPYAGLQSAYASLWIFMLWLEKYKHFDWQYTSPKIALMFNFIVQFVAFIIMAVAFETTNQKGLGYLIAQGIITLHTTVFDFILVVCKLSQK